MTLPAVLYLYPGNTQVLRLEGLADVTTGLFLDAATVTATLLDQRGQSDPILNDITMTYVPASNGIYQGTVPGTFSPPAFTGQNSLGGYRLQVSATQAGVVSLFTVPVILALRSQQ